MKRTIAITAFIVLSLTFFSYECYDYYMPQQFILKESSGGGGIKRLHTAKCEVVKSANEVNKVNEADVVEGYFLDEFDFCPLCNPKFSAKSVVDYYNINIGEHELIKEHYKRYESIIKKAEVAKTEAMDSEIYKSAKGNFLKKGLIYQAVYSEKLNEAGISGQEVESAEHYMKRKRTLDTIMPKIKSYISDRKNIIAVFKGVPK